MPNKYSYYYIECFRLLLLVPVRFVWTELPYALD